MDTQELMIGYVLGILDAEEQYEAERLIARDGRIRSEVERLQDDIHLLAYAAPAVAPAPLVKERLFQRIHEQKQRVTLSAQPVATRQMNWAWALALTIVVALGGWNVGLRNENVQLRDQNRLLAQQLDTTRETNNYLVGQMDTADEAIQFLVAPSTTSRALSGTASAPGASGIMYMQPGNQVAIVIVDGLQPLPEGNTYQFWLARVGEPPIPSDTFEVDADGHAQLVIQAVDEVNAFQQVMVTIEPSAGANPTPSTSVLEGNL